MIAKSPRYCEISGHDCSNHSNILYIYFFKYLYFNII